MKWRDSSTRSGMAGDFAGACANGAQVRSARPAPEKTPCCQRSWCCASCATYRGLDAQAPNRALNRAPQDQRPSAGSRVSAGRPACFARRVYGESGAPKGIRIVEHACGVFRSGSGRLRIAAGQRLFLSRIVSGVMSRFELFRGRMASGWRVRESRAVRLRMPPGVVISMA